MDVIANIFAQRFGNPIFGGQWPVHQPMPPVQMPFQPAPINNVRMVGPGSGLQYPQPPMQAGIYQPPVNALRMRYGLQ